MIYTFVTDDRHSEYNPSWIQMCRRDGIVAAHLHRYREPSISAIDHVLEIDSVFHTPPHHYQYVVSGGTTLGTSLDQNKAGHKRERTVSFLSFLKGAAEVYNDTYKLEV